MITFRSIVQDVVDFLNSENLINHDLEIYFDDLDNYKDLTIVPDNETCIMLFEPMTEIMTSIVVSYKAPYSLVIDNVFKCIAYSLVIDKKSVTELSNKCDELLNKYALWCAKIEQAINYNGYLN